MLKENHNRQWNKHIQESNWHRFNSSQWNKYILKSNGHGLNDLPIPKREYYFYCRSSEKSNENLHLDAQGLKMIKLRY